MFGYNCNVVVVNNCIAVTRRMHVWFDSTNIKIKCKLKYVQSSCKIKLSNEKLNSAASSALI